jgi:CBS domain-containing protein
VLVKPGSGNAVLCARAQGSRSESPELARAWISRPALTVRDDMRAVDVAEMMLEYEADPFLVVDARGEAVGLLAIRDVLRAATDRSLDGRVAVEFMRPLPRPMSEDAPMSEAALRLAEERTQVVPLCDASGRVTSLLTGVDVAEWAAERARRQRP